MNKKKCTKCGESKPLSKEFSHRNKRTKTGFTCHCKVCVKKKTERWRKENPRHMSKWYENNFRKQKENRRPWRKKNPERKSKTDKLWAKNNVERIRAKRKEWAYRNKEHIRKQKKKYQKERRKNPKYRLSCNMRSAISSTLSGVKGSLRHVNYSIDELKEHLESLFEDGMSWNNYGAWHVDHIRPVSSFQYESPESPEFKDCWSLKNLQPLWAYDNLSKGNKLTQT